MRKLHHSAVTFTCAALIVCAIMWNGRDADSSLVGRRASIVAIETPSMNIAHNNALALKLEHGELKDSPQLRITKDNVRQVLDRSAMKCGKTKCFFPSVLNSSVGYLVKSFNPADKTTDETTDEAGELLSAVQLGIFLEKKYGIRQVYYNEEP